MTTSRIIGLNFLVIAWLGSGMASGQPPAEQARPPLELPDLDALRLGPVGVNPGVIEADQRAGAMMPLSIANGPQDPSTQATSGRGEWVAAPIPSYKPVFGVSVTGMAGYIYRPGFVGSNTPPWVTGAAGFYAENGSWAAGLGHKMNLADDRWRLLVGAGYGDVNYDFYGIGSDAGNQGKSIGISQQFLGGVAEVLYEAAPHLYAGVRYMGGLSNIQLDSSGLNLPPDLIPPKIELDAFLSALAPRIQYDTRDNQFYPTQGTLVDFESAFFSEAFGSDFEFQTYSLSCNQYLGLGEQLVLAFRGHGRYAAGDAPFFALSSFGSGSDLRGYTPGRYRDRVLLAGQVEVRWRIFKRLGVVAFAGLGSVAPAVDAFKVVLPSGGCGVRYVLGSKNNVSLRFDAAWGRQDHAFYLGIGEAF